MRNRRFRKNKTKIRPINRQHKRNVLVIMSKVKNAFCTFMDRMKSNRIKATTEKNNNSKTSEEQFQLTNTNNSSNGNTSNNVILDDLNDKKDADVIKVSIENPKGVKDDIKDLAKILKSIATIGTAFILVISTIKIIIYQYFFGVPVLNLINNLTVFYSVILNSIILGLVIFLIYAHFYMIDHIKVNKSIVERINVWITPVFCILTTVLILIVAYYYAFYNVGADAKWLGLTYGIIAFIIYTVILIGAYVFPLMWYYRLNKMQRKDSICEASKEDNENRCKRQELINIKLKISKTITLISAAIIICEFFLVFVYRLYQNDVLPNKIHDYEIVTIGTQDYVTVCNSSNGKLVVMCELYYEDDVYPSLIVYKGIYRIIDPNDYLYIYRHFSNVDSTAIWHSPVKTIKGPDDVSIVFSDELYGNNNNLETNSTCSFYVDIVNNSNKTLRIGDTYKIEVYEYGKWRNWFYQEVKGLDNSARTIEPEEVISTRLDFFTLGKLEEGHYRIALSSDESSSSYYYVEFKINSKGEFEQLV